MTEQRQAGRFLKILGRREVLALAFGAMIGWSWVVLTGTWIWSAGVMGSIAAFLVGGAGIALIGSTYAELILLIGGLSSIAPLFGRPALVWLVDAGGLGIVVAYGMVALSFLVLRKKEPELARPYRVRFGKTVGTLALLVSVGLAALYLPGSPAALAWPQEWLIVILWIALGVIFYAVARRHRRSG